MKVNNNANDVGSGFVKSFLIKVETKIWEHMAKKELCLFHVNYQSQISIAECRISFHKNH